MTQYQTKSIFWSDSIHYQMAAIVRASFVTPGDPTGQWWEKLLFEEEKHVTSFLVWHRGMLYRIPLIALTAYFLLRWILYACFTEEVMLFVWRNPGHYNKVLSWEWSNLLSSYPWHANTASKALGLHFLMLLGCCSTLEVFKKIYYFILAPLGY